MLGELGPGLSTWSLLRSDKTLEGPCQHWRSMAFLTWAWTFQAAAAAAAAAT